MDTNNKWEQVKGFFRKIGRRNLIIAGAVVVIGAAVALNWAFFSKANDQDGYDYKASAGMSTNYGTNLTTSAVGDDKSPTTPTGSDAYFSTVEVSRKKARDEAIEVLNAVVRNDKATEDVKAQAMQELQALAKDMEKEANIESLLQARALQNVWQSSAATMQTSSYRTKVRSSPHSWRRSMPWCLSRPAFSRPISPSCRRTDAAAHQEKAGRR